MASSSRLILLHQRLLAHYRSDVFSRLAQRCPNILVVYGQQEEFNTVSPPPSPGSFPTLPVRNYSFGRTGKVYYSAFLSLVFQIRPSIIITPGNLGNLNLYSLLMLRSILGYKLVVWTFGYNPPEAFNPQARPADRLRLQLYRSADAVVFYWKHGRDLVAPHLPGAEHLFVAPNTLDTGVLERLRLTFDTLGREKLRYDLGIKAALHFIYVGRLLPDKELDLLLDAFVEVQARFPSVELTVIGSGPEEGRLKSQAAEYPLLNIRFLGEILDPATVGKWIYVSDAFVHPGRLGLAAVHAFALGTPIVTQPSPRFSHGEGIGYVHDGENSLLFRSSGSPSLAEQLLRIAQDPSLVNRLREGAVKTAQSEASIDRMIDGFQQAIEFVCPDLGTNHA